MVDNDISYSDHSDDSPELSENRKRNSRNSPSTSKDSTDDAEKSDSAETSGSHRISDISSAHDNGSSIKQNDTIQESCSPDTSSARSSINVDENTDRQFVHEIIKEKFLVNMPDDFYKFWDFCKKLKSNSVSEALKEVGLTLIGPFDILAGKFNDVTKNEAEYLIHWRYYRDPPECQTVLRGDDGTGFHIGYFRDSPDDDPVFLVGNHVKKNGILTPMGANIFSAVK